MPTAKTTEIVKFDAENYAIVGLEPDDLREAIAANLEGESLSFSDLQRIKVPSGGGLAWQIPNPENPNRPRTSETFEGVIVHTELGRVMWLKTIDGGGKKGAPDCSGKLGDDGTMTGNKSRGWIYEAAKALNVAADKPTGNVDALQNCEGCPFAQPGSGKGNSQKCALKRAFYVATEDSLLPTAIVAPPGSLANAKKYLVSLATRMVDDGTGRRRPLKYDEVVTEFSLEPAKSGEGIDYARIVFRNVATLPPEQRQSFKVYKSAIQPIIRNMSRAVLSETPVTTSSDDGDGYSVEYIDETADELPTAED